MVGKNTLKSLVLLLQADLILIIPEKHFHILSLQIKKKKRKRKSERYFPLLLQESLLGVSVWEMKGVLEMDGSDGKVMVAQEMCKYLHLKLVKVVNFVMYF